MNPPRSESRSEYLHWAKTSSRARYNLATSGIEGLALAELPFRVEDLELSVHGSYGYPPLQKRLARRYSVPVECVVAATGTSMANHLAMAAILEPGDEVLMEEPAYSPLLDVARYLGATVTRFTRRFEDEFRIDISELARKVSGRTRLIVLTNLHNPSGVETPESVLPQIGEIAAQVGAKVLVDEVYLEMKFERPARTIFRLGEPFVVTSSLTKAFGLSGLRCGWVLAEPALAEKMWRLNDLYGVIPAAIAERLSVVALDHLDAIAARARRLLTANRALLTAFLESRDDLDVVHGPHGTIAFGRLRSGSGETFCKILRDKYETSVVPGRFFGMPDCFRIGVGGPTEDVRDALRQFNKALDES